MVSRIDDFHVRWDFIGLSTDEKPTPETNDQVVNGSTFYTTDNSKLYIWYEGTWFQKVLSYDGSYILPIASHDVLGGIKVGDNLSIDADGTLSSNADLSNYYDKDEIDDIIDGLSVVTLKIVTELPEAGQPNVIYLVGREGTNIYDQWIYTDDSWHNIGDTSIDLSDYYTKDEADEKFQEKLEAGDEYTEVTDTTTVTDVKLATKEVSHFNLRTLWNYIKGKMNGAISLGIDQDFTGNRALVSTPLGKISYSGVTAAELSKLEGATDNIQDKLDDHEDRIGDIETELDNKQHKLFASPELVNFTDTVPLSSVSLDGNTVTPVKGLTIWNYIKNKITSTWATNFLDKVYPVGAIYISTSSSSPATLFGGTWERIQDRFLLGAGSTYSAGTTGGSATKTISRSNLPNTTVTTTSKGKKEFDLSGVKGFAYQGGGVDNKWGLEYGRKELYEKKSYTATEETASNHTHSFNLNGNVTQTALNIMPPYLTVYMWKRTA